MKKPSFWLTQLLTYKGPNRIQNAVGSGSKLFCRPGYFLYIRMDHLIIAVLRFKFEKIDISPWKVGLNIVFFGLG